MHWASISGVADTITRFSGFSDETIKAPFSYELRVGETLNPNLLTPDKNVKLVDVESLTCIRTVIREREREHVVPNAYTDAHGMPKFHASRFIFLHF